MSRTKPVDPPRPHRRPRRSVLYVPGSNGRALAKCSTLAADTVILDLEDSVAPEKKLAAREAVLAHIGAHADDGTAELIVRINAPGTLFGADDLTAMSGACLDGILVPKIDRATNLGQVRRELDACGGENVPLWIMLETPRAILNVATIASAAADCGLIGFVLGTNDLAKETAARIVPGRLPMVAWLSSCVAAAKAFGLVILDGVFNDIADAEGFVRECRDGRDLGMDGKTLIHPSQIAPANAVFAPSTEEERWARAVVDAFAVPENADKGALLLEGRMVERLHATMARETIDMIGAISDAESRRHARLVR